MGHVRLSEHIDAPIDHVWDINASCERLPEWNVNVVEVKDCQGRLDRVGHGSRRSSASSAPAPLDSCPSCPICTWKPSGMGSRSLLRQRQKPAGCSRLPIPPTSPRSST